MAGLKLSRDQLAQFLKSHEQIRQFENLFSAVDEIAPDVVDEINTLAGNAQATAVQALDSLSRIAAALEILALAPTIQDVVFPDNLAPPLQIGTMGEQQRDNVSITGGTVTAQLTNNQTILLATSATLTNGSGALAGTLLNSPVAGNPTKWITINDNGTTRQIPTW